MTQALARFLEEPTGPHFLAAWRSVTKSGRQVDFAALRTLLDAGRAREVQDYLDDLPRWLKLSPRVQELAILAAEQAGDKNDVRLARFLFASCIEGILDAGDGSQHAPYLAVLPTDEAVILAVLGREAVSQALVECRSRMLDVVLCRDGGEVCFDITHTLSPAKLKANKAKVRTKRKTAVSS